MQISSKVSKDETHWCRVCGQSGVTEPSQTAEEALCSYCGNLLWFTTQLEKLELDFLLDEGSFFQLESKTKQAAIEDLIQIMVEQQVLNQENAQDVLASLQKREEYGSTGIGRGIAIPHTAHASVTQLTGIAAYHEQGLDFESLDGRQVHKIFLLLAPPNQVDAKLRAMSALVKALK
ncbi:MAG: hypothetical protein COA78_34515 [Blastopirellula sp.]|nr:MAG: hypothetical protein COA78_34515 [Blastopirellula sp.]